MFASGFLKDPANSKIRRTLSHFAPGEQLVQLCNMEGLEQIRRAEPRYDPDVLVSYAMADTVTSGLTLIADGASLAVLDNIELTGGYPDATPQDLAIVDDPASGLPSKIYVVDYFRETVRPILLAGGPPYARGPEIAPR